MFLALFLACCRTVIYQNGKGENAMRRNLRRLALLASTAALALGLTAATASASVTQVINATVTGTSTSNPTNGTLYVYDNATALHHTRSVVYYQHDGYSKTENLVDRANPIGVVLKQEDIENACASSLTDASLNPTGGYAIPCVGQLVTSAPAAFPLGGDLIGRFCRKAQSPDPSPADCTADSVHVNESATGTGRYLKVGNKDHGGMTEVDYYTNVTGVNVEVDVFLPAVAATDYNGTPVTTQAEVTRIVLLPLDATHTVNQAVLVLN